MLYYVSKSRQNLNPLPYLPLCTTVLTKLINELKLLKNLENISNFPFLPDYIEFCGIVRKSKGLFRITILTAS